MNEIFIIRSIPMDYESCPDNIGFVETEDLAIKKVNHLNDILQKAKNLREQIYEYESKIIRPSLPPKGYEKTPDLPKWKSGISEKEITTEMREERIRIKQLQAEIMQRGNQTNLRKYQTRYAVFLGCR